MSDNPRPTTAAILTLGCKLNIADSEVIARRLRDAGWSVVERLSADRPVDAVIVNSCSVTHVADHKSGHLVRMAQRVAPGATVALTGCLLETAPQEKLDALAATLVYRQPDQQALADRLIALHAPGPTPPETPDDLPPLPQGEGWGEGLQPPEAPASLPQKIVRSVVLSPKAPDNLLPLPQGEGWGEGLQPPEAPKLLPQEATRAESHAPETPDNQPPLPQGEGWGEGRPRKAFKTRAFIAAQEGCNDVCAFCIIPKTRGRERSKPIDWVVAEARKREAEGVQEIVITGTQLGHYGSDLGVRLHDLMRALLRESGIPRIRMSSVQPQDLDDALIELWTDPRMCRHYHLALQSGSPGVLQRMRRRYTQDEFRDAVHRLRAAVPGIAITTDVIAGFPGETAEEFEECYAFCEEMAFAGIHVFPYSQRSGTVAYKLPGQVPDAVKKERVRRLTTLGASMASAYRRNYLDTTTSVLWEDRHEGERWEGLTDTYVRVRTRSTDDLANRLTPVRIAGLSDDGLVGEIMT